MGVTTVIDAVDYLTAADVLVIHAAALGIPDHAAPARLRSFSALDGAVHRPEWRARYEGAGLALQATYLAHGIAEGQPFVDGNKRTALASMHTFLRMNGMTLSAAQGERAQWMLLFAEGVSVLDVAARVEQALIPVLTIIEAPIMSAPPPCRVAVGRFAPARWSGAVPVARRGFASRTQWWWCGGILLLHRERGPRSPDPRRKRRAPQGPHSCQPRKTGSRR